MTTLVPISPHEQQQFDSPPNFNAHDRSMFFKLDEDAIKILNSLITPINRLGFTLQFGYFKSQGKFFMPSQFKPRDIDYVSKIFNIFPQKICFDGYQKKILQDHRKKILELLGWHKFDQRSSEKLAKHIAQYTKNQLPPRQVFLVAIDYCWQNKIEVPTYNALTQLITASYNDIELSLLEKIGCLLTLAQKESLLSVVGVSETKKILNQNLKQSIISQLF